MRNLLLAAAALTLIGAPAYAASKKAETNTTAPKTERHYDCTKKGNANKAECKTEAAAPAASAKPATASKPAATTPAGSTRAAPKYDCTKKGNANKAACKSEAAPMPAAPAAKPVVAAPAKPVAAPAPAPKAASAPAMAAAPAAKAAPVTSGKTPSPAQKANQDKMKACGASWDKLSEAQKTEWKAKGEKFKDKNGKAYTGWITYSIDCRKK